MRISPILALSFSLAAIVSACATTGDEGPDGAPAEGVSERGEALTWAFGMEWTGAHKLMLFSHGEDYESVVDSSPTAHEVFQVLVDPKPSSTGTIRVSKEWDENDTSNCPNHTMSVRALAQNTGSSTWYEVREINATSQSDGGNPNGEFGHRCRVGVDIAVTPSMAQVRVMSQARTKVEAGQVFAYFRDAVTVSADLESPAPKLAVTADILPNGSLSASVTNVGPVTADATDTMLVFAYDYCPPPKPGEPFYCEHSNAPIGTCLGPICGPLTMAGPRDTIPCTWSKSFNGNQINANGGVGAWTWGQPGLQDRCGLCNPNDNRCVNIRASVTSRVTSVPYHLMPSVQDKDNYNGVL